MASAAEAVVRRQFDTYNAHDLEGFLATFAPDVEMRTLPRNEIFLSGHEDVRKFYREKRFNLQALRAELVNSIVMGDTVIYHERLRGLEPGKVVETVAIYGVSGGLIQRVWFIRP
ncbi:MAG: nuclear transport factor 2 family protein [Alphaproteobacteria bacterium]